jgi:hypothetical protein
MTMRLQMYKGSLKTTLGDLQGDQSKVQLSKCPSFIVVLREQSDQRSSMWLCIIMTSYIKGEIRALWESSDFHVEPDRNISIKVWTN